MLMQAVAIQTAVFRGYDLIAFACSTLESRAILHLDAAPVPDETADPLQLRQPPATLRPRLSKVTWRQAIRH